MSIKLAVFDMAGTTVEDRDFVHRALIEALADENITVNRDEVNEVMGYPKPVAIAKLLEDKKNDDSITPESYILKIHENFVNKMVGFYATDPQVKAKDGAEEVFASLKEKGIKVALDTGFDRKIADTIINRLGWNDGVIDMSITSDEVENGRPFPDMIFEAMKKASISQPENVMKIGDTISDLLEGKAAGCKFVIGVTTGAFSKEELSGEYHTHLIDDLRKIIDIV